MSGFSLSRGAASAVLAAVGLAVPMALAPSAHAAIEPAVSVSMSGSVLGAVNAASVGCPETAQATLRNPDGSPVFTGTVDFFSNLNGQSGNFVGTAPVSNGTASIAWVPDMPGQHVVSAIYHDGSVEYSTAAGQATIMAVNLAGACI